MDHGDREILPKTRSRDASKPGLRLIAHRDHREGHTLMIPGFDGCRSHELCLHYYDPHRNCAQINLVPPAPQKTRDLKADPGEIVSQHHASVVAMIEVNIGAIEEEFDVPMSRDLIADDKMSLHIASDGSLCLKIPRKP